jgi:outer membrane protein assembly factor BamB
MIGSSALGKAGDKDAIFATTAIPFSTRDPQSSFEELFSSPNKAFALHAIDATTGDVLWDAPIPLPSYAAAVYANGVVFLADTFGMSIQAYDANLGVPLWAAPLNGAPSSGPAVAGDSIYLGAGTNAPPVPLGSVGGIWAFQLATSVLPY